MKYFDVKNNRLVHLRERAGSNFWDNHWGIGKGIRKILELKGDTYITETTSRYLFPQDGIILEGGCGKGHNVALLTNHCYKLPVISSDDNGTKCYICPGVNGCIFKSKDSESLKGKILKIIKDRNVIKKNGFRKF